jgi:hypothetical protein
LRWDLTGKLDIRRRCANHHSEGAGLHRPLPGVDAVEGEVPLLEVELQPPGFAGRDPDLDFTSSASGAADLLDQFQIPSSARVTSPTIDLSPRHRQ